MLSSDSMDFELPILVRDTLKQGSANSGLRHLRVWVEKIFLTLRIRYNAIKLNLDPSLSNYLVISPKLKTQIPKMCIILNNLMSSASVCIKYLGINVDAHLNFFTRIKSIEH